MSTDLRKRYDEIVQSVEAAKQRHATSVAQAHAAKQRRDELAEEARTLGVENIDNIDQHIAMLEGEITAELESIEQGLKSLDVGSVPTLPASASQPTAGITHSLDELLAEGGTPSRRIK